VRSFLRFGKLQRCVFFGYFVAGIVATMAHGAAVPKPSQFYAVSVFFSDNGARFYYRILDVRQDGSDAVVCRSVRPYCAQQCILSVSSETVDVVLDFALRCR
jgi:hypothetical protein